jgi:hypothetical protein
VGIRIVLDQIISSLLSEKDAEAPGDGDSNHMLSTCVSGSYTRWQRSQRGGHWAL